MARASRPRRWRRPSSTLTPGIRVPAGTSARGAADRALEAQGAKRAPEPPQSSAYPFSRLRWDVLPVVQNYNPAGQVTSAARTALTNTYGD